MVAAASFFQPKGRLARTIRIGHGMLSGPGGSSGVGMLSTTRNSSISSIGSPSGSVMPSSLSTGLNDSRLLSLASAAGRSAITSCASFVK